jgi:hypothetical protein
MKQTAVEQFIEKLEDQEFWQNMSMQTINISIKVEDYLKLKEQAKEMEFERRKKDFVNGYKARAKESNLIFDETSEKYAIYLFNETFKSE